LLQLHRYVSNSLTGTSEKASTLRCAAAGAKPAVPGSAAATRGS
jgi:hypothetical protein